MDPGRRPREQLNEAGRTNEKWINTYKSIFHFSAELQCHYDVAGLPTQQSHQKPRCASGNRSEGGAFLTTDGGADCRRDACGCRYQKSLSFPRSAFSAAKYYDPCVHIHLYREISNSTSTPRSVHRSKRENQSVN